jgi:hypothetical protein
MSEVERRHFLQNTAAERLKTLTQIAEHSARPWTDYYLPPASSENWYEAYFQSENS